MLNTFCSFRNITRIGHMSRHLRARGRERKHIKILVENPERKRDF
jgi:hypothetical protein